jgi:hypothetical protein
MKYKVGDRVKIVVENSGNYSDCIGKVCTIEQLDGLGYYLSGLPHSGLRWQDNEFELVKEEQVNKFYRVKKDNYQFDAGAILKLEEGRYVPISDLWDRVDGAATGIGKKLVEAKQNEEWFDRVYDVNVLGKTKYLAKEAAREAHEK